ncbi:MAG: hypothetical protein PHF63_00885 [Herbinix sp.]|nr:hypothetical protein [Herbinix sp.]
MFIINNLYITIISILIVIISSEILKRIFFTISQKIISFDYYLGDLMIIPENEMSEELYDEYKNDNIKKITIDDGDMTKAENVVLFNKEKIDLDNYNILINSIFTILRLISIIEIMRILYLLIINDKVYNIYYIGISYIIISIMILSLDFIISLFTNIFSLFVNNSKDKIDIFLSKEIPYNLYNTLYNKNILYKDMIKIGRLLIYHIIINEISLMYLLYIITK